MKRIDWTMLPMHEGSAYPPPFSAACAERQRHWHSAEDEFVCVLAGEVVLVTDAGEELLRPGDCVGFAAGVPNGHHLQNRGTEDAILLEVGSRRPDADAVDYPGIDLVLEAGDRAYRHRDGTAY